MNLIMSNPGLVETTNWNIALKIALVFLAIFVCTTFPVLLITVLTNSNLKKQNEAFEKELRAQADHYIDLARSNRELRRFRHDFGNISIGLKKSIKDENYSAALAMLDESHESLYRATEGILRYDTGNGIVDALLSDKQNRAAEKNIVIRFDGVVPPDALSPMDLCVIFGNTLDNAVEACEKLPDDEEKIISVSSQCSSGFMFIKITNPTAEDVKIKANTVDTTKQDSARHGYGLYSLRQTVKKYDGELNLSCENRIFTVEIDVYMTRCDGK